MITTMSYDFDTLFSEYVQYSNENNISLTSVQDFIDMTNAMINDRLDDGEDPRPQDLFIMGYVSDMLKDDPDWIKTYAS